jgi:hypothetical protein
VVVRWSLLLSLGCYSLPANTFLSCDLCRSYLGILKSNPNNLCFLIRQLRLSLFTVIINIIGLKSANYPFVFTSFSFFSLYLN